MRSAKLGAALPRPWWAVATAAAAMGLSIGLVPAGPAMGSAERGQGVAQAVAQQCSASFDPYTVSKSVLTGCGDSIAPLTKIQQLPGGGKAYVYDVAGHTSVTRIPPPGFNPLAASAASLTEYGYPPRPASDAALSQWRAIVSNSRAVPAPSYLVNLRIAQTPASSLTTKANPIWAGIAAKENSGSQRYHDIYAYYYEPHIYTSNCHVTAESTWVGLGGQQTDKIAQAGTAVGERRIGAHQAWYELINGGTDILMPIKGLYATKGKKFFAEVDRVSSGYFIYLENAYTRAHWSSTISFSPFDGLTAEMIVEDPESGWTHGGPALANFRFFTVADAEASRNGMSYAGLGHWPHDNDIMEVNGTVMAYASATSNSGKTWVDHQLHCE